MVEKYVWIWQSGAHETEEEEAGGEAQFQTEEMSVVWGAVLKAGSGGKEAAAMGDET